MRNYTTQLLKDITDKMDLISGEEEIDYFSYLRGSDITEGMHCGGYKEAIANALSAANAFEHEIRKDAEDAKAKLTAIFLEAERADVQCYMTLREVSETLKDWMLLARKLRLSMTGGGGYGEQLFCENNIKQWTGETAARLEKESYSAEERAEDRNEAFLAGQYTGGMPSEIYEGYIRQQETYRYVRNVSEQLISITSRNETLSGVVIDNNVQLFFDVIEANSYISPEVQALYQTLPNFYNTYYEHNDARVPSISDNLISERGLDCGGLVMAIFSEALGIHISKSGSAGAQERGTNMMMTSTSLSCDNAARSTDIITSEWETGASIGVIIQNCPFVFPTDPDDSVTKEEVNQDLLEPGDVLYYDWSGGNSYDEINGHPDGTADHVAIYIGEDDCGRGVIFEICSPDNPPHFDYLSADVNSESDDSLSPGWGYDNIIQVRRYI